MSVNGLVPVEKPESWCVNDCDWMTKREAEWLHIEKRLPAIPLKRSQWPYLKTYFLTGEPMPSYGPFSYILQWWFHPAGIYPKQFGGVWMVRTGFVDLLDSIRATLPGGDADYGYMGKKGSLILRHIHRGWDTDEPIQFDTKNGGASDCGYVAGDVFNFWTHTIRLELLGCGYIANHPFLLLEKDVLEIMEISPRAAFERRTRGEPLPKGKFQPNLIKANRRIQGFKEALTFFDRDPDDPALHRPKTVKYVNTLVGRYEKKEYPKALMYLWDMAAKQVEEERKKPKKKKSKGTAVRKKVSKKKASTKKQTKTKVSKKNVALSKKKKSSKKKIVTGKTSGKKKKTGRG